MSNDLLSPQALAERKRIQDAIRRIAARYQSEGRIVEEVTVRRAMEELFDVSLQEEKLNHDRW